MPATPPPLVSCIVPVHNGERHLAQAIESILAQSHEPLEILIVDDASTDATAAIAAGYGSRVRVLTQAVNNGPVTARATGVRAARGEYIAFLDADDVWLAEKTTRQLAHLNGRSRLDVSLCEIEDFWEPGQESEAERAKAAERTRGSHLWQCTLARREVFERVPIDAGVRHMDHAAWVLALREAGIRLAVLPSVLAHRRRHDANTSRSNEGEIYEEVFDLLKRTLDRRRARDG
jgi:glycosyltransferase involved in cell wall biosynthesis